MTLAIPQMHWPSSKLSWELKQELRKGQGAQWGLMFTFNLPGVTLYASFGAIAVPGLGQFESKVIEVSPLARATSDRARRIESIEEDVTIDDTDRVFAGAVEGPQGHLVRGSTFTQVLGSPSVGRAQWFTVFAGIIDGYQMVGPNRWKLTLRPSDLALRKPAPRAVIQKADWLNADAAAYAQYGPLLYGTHDSSSTTSKGAVPLVYVDKTSGSFKYLLCWGRAKSVDRVYSDGVNQGSGWTVVYKEVGGRRCTLVVFTVDQGTKAITADCTGYETIGDGSGTLIEAPTDVIRHVLTNWIFGDYKTGNWLAESTAPIDAPSFNATAIILARVGARASRRIFGAQKLGQEILNEWASSWQVRLFWSNAGKIACRIEDFSPLSLYRDDQTGWLRYDGDPTDVSLTYDWESLTSRINIDYHFQEAAGKYLFTQEIRDPSLNFEAPLSLQIPWSLVALATDPGAGETVIQTDIFTVGGTWTKKSGATSVRVIILPPGGGGGGGRRGDNATNSGGGGGGGGGLTDVTLAASACGATETVTVGTAGTGGAGTSVDSTNGGNGTNGGPTSFGALVTGAPGAFGQGGQAGAGGNGGAGGAGNKATGGAGGHGNDSTNGGLGGGGTPTGGGAGGGGGGSGLGSGADGGAGPTTVYGTPAAGTGGTQGVNGGAGGNFTGPNSDPNGGGGGGGGGGFGSATNGGLGGAGGTYGAGGAGGGSGNNTANRNLDSGAGGNGGPGIVVVVQKQLKGSSLHGSRTLRWQRLPGAIIDAPVPSFEFLDHELVDMMALSQPNLPSADGRGAGVKPWERMPVLKLRSEIDWAAGIEHISLRDIRSYLCRHWDVAKSNSVAQEFGEGIARLDVGTTRVWTRASSCWVYRPDRLMALVAGAADKHDIEGDLFESASTNEIIQSAFKNGNFTGWTKTGTGSNGSACDPDTNDNLFATIADGSGQSVKFTAGNPVHAADLQLQGGATASYVANQILTGVFWRKDDSGQPLWYAVQRAFDSQWWRESDQTWQAAKTWNPMTGGSSIPTRYITKQINVGANATTLTPFFGLPTAGSVAGQINHLYHVQIEKKNYPTSAIVTEATTVPRSADMLTISNNTSARSWPEDWGTFRCKARPWWSTSALPAGAKMTLAYTQHDANNYDWLYYDQASASFKFERKAGGVTYTASKAVSLTAFTTYNVACRWTSTFAELGLPAYTLSVFVWADGTSGAGSKGTDATAAALVWAGTSSFEIGSQAGALNWDGNIWAQEVTQQVLTDSAVARY